MKRNNRTPVLLLVVFGLALFGLVFVAGCGGEGETTTTAGQATTTAAPADTGSSTSAATTGEVKTLKIGTIMPLQGPLSIVGIAFDHSWDIYAEKMNEQGGVKIGDDKYKIEFIHEDSKGSAEGAGVAASKLVNQDKVQFVIGALLDSEVEAIYQVTQPAGVLFGMANIDTPGAPVDVSPERDLLIRLTVNVDDNHGLNLDYLRKAYPNAKKIAIVAPDLGYETIIDKLTSDAAGRGMEVVFVEKWAWGTIDFVPTMTKVIASNPDIIWALNTAQTGDQVKAARQLGFKGPILSNSPIGADTVVVVVQDPAMLTDVICNSPDVTHPTPEMQEIMDRWAAKWPDDPFISDAVHAYDVPWVIVQGMERAGSIEPAAVLAALETMTNKGDLQTNEGAGYMGGMERFGVNRVYWRPFPITRIMNGEMEFLGYFDPVE